MIVGAHNVCLVGWHVPTVTQTAALIVRFGGSGVAGEFLKEIGTEHWIDLNIDGHNTSVMSVRGAGLRNNNNSAEFGAIDEAAAMWTSSSTSDGKV